MNKATFDGPLYSIDDLQIYDLRFIYDWIYLRLTILCVNGLFYR